MKIIFSNKYVRYSLLMTGGIFLGWLLFHSPKKSEDKHEHSTEEARKTIWTCSMHPQIRMNKPGKCPICGMDLIPLNQSNVQVDPAAVHLTKEAAALANVMTSVVSHQKPVKEVRLYGKVQADERLFQSQVAHIPGRIEKLYVNFTGESVKKGQSLALIYSPELITAQQELIEASKTKDMQPEIYEAAKEKLHLWKLSQSQISEIENSGRVQNYFPILSNTSGVITERLVNAGDHVQEGTILFNVADLSRIWIMFDAYESDLPFLKKGEKIRFTIQALPGNEFTGDISFIDPFMDPVTRVSKVRVEIANQGGKLKPEMFATGIVNANLQEYANKLVIPRSAVLWTGKRSVVYVKQAGSDEPVFKMREIELGPALGSGYVVVSGLEDGEEIVTQGTFSVDAAAQLEGKPSMMNPEAARVSARHDHSDVSEMKKQENTVNEKVAGNEKFSVQLGAIYDHYIMLKNALVQSDAAKTKQYAGQLQKALSGVDMNLLSGDAHRNWMNISDVMNKSISKITSSSDLEEQRTAFSGLSNQLYKAVKMFGLKNKTGFYQYCPMANSNKGAYWLSEIREIRNPYYGEAMLTCGETKEVIK